jgi:hypothetical protein
MYRSSPSDMHLKSILMTVNTKLEPELAEIILGKHQWHVLLRFIFRPHHARIKCNKTQVFLLVVLTDKIKVFTL